MPHETGGEFSLRKAVHKILVDEERGLFPWLPNLKTIGRKGPVVWLLELVAGWIIGAITGLGDVIFNAIVGLIPPVVQARDSVFEGLAVIGNPFLAAITGLIEVVTGVINSAGPLAPILWVALAAGLVVVTVRVLRGLVDGIADLDPTGILTAGVSILRGDG
jgi:hypothetical protein